MSSPTEPWERRVSQWSYVVGPIPYLDCWATGGYWVVEATSGLILRDSLLTEQYKEGAD